MVKQLLDEGYDMAERVVTNQAELDAAVAAGDVPRIEAGGRFDLTACPKVIISTARESSQPYVVARGSSQPYVVARESSQPYVVARESSQPCVEARESSQPRVEARESSQPYVEARESSQPCVEARESSQPYVEARESSQPRVVARESSQPYVVARESSQPYVEARESSQPYVEARESSQPRVVARGSSQLQARGSMEVKVGAYAVVTCDGKVRVVEGTNIVRVPNLTEVPIWLEYHGIAVDGETATLFKGVGPEWQSENYLPDRTLPRYEPGATVEAPDWRQTSTCGGGLHLSPTPRHTDAYHSWGKDARYVAVQVALDDLVLIGNPPDKAKVRACEVLHEVDRDGKPLVVERAS